MRPFYLPARRLALVAMACMLAGAAQAQPWPRPLLVGPGHGHCPDFYQALSVQQARQPELLSQLRALPPGAYGLADGKYLSRPEGGTLLAAPPAEAASLPRNLCLGLASTLHADRAPRPVLPDAQGRLRYLDVQVGMLERLEGKACALFSQRGRAMAAGCLDAPLSSPETDRLLQAFRLGSTLRLSLDSRQPRGWLATGQQAYRIESLSY